MNCRDFEEISGAFALDSVTFSEREVAEAHLAQCPRCTRLLREYRSALALLPLSIEPVMPPETLQKRIFAIIQQDTLPLSAFLKKRHVRSPRKKSWRLPLLLMALFLVFAGLGSLLAWNISLMNETGTLHSEISTLKRPDAGLTQTADEAIIFTMYRAQSIHQANGSLIYLPRQHLVMLVLRDLPRPQGTHMYQGWLLRHHRPTSIGLLALQNDIVSVNFPGDVTGYDTVLVSLEPGPRASKSVPIGPPVAVCTLH